MKYVFFVDNDIEVAFERYEGVVVKQDLIDAVQQSSVDPEWKTKKLALTDIRDAQFDLTYNDMVEFIYSLPEWDRLPKHAIVVTRKTEHGTARMYGVASERISYCEQCQVFYNVDEAKHWLGIEDYTNPAIEWLG